MQNPRRFLRAAGVLLGLAVLIIPVNFFVFLFS